MQLLWMCCIFWAALVNGNTTDVETKPSLRHNDWRLPRSLVPRHYRVRLLPYLKEGNFTTDGHVEILVECKEETDLIILHMADISIVSGSLQVQDFVELRPVRIKSYAEDKKRQFLIITTRNETLTMGKFYKISMDFVGQLNDKLNGFYRSSYIENGVRKYLATTQFSPTDARRAFPCFDEPVMKARFQITLGRHQSKTATSNMPLKKTAPHESLEEYVWDEFETTLPMSTYVLAFIVHEFQGIDSPPELSHVHFRIWSRPSAVNQTEYARYLGPKILDYFETFFNISFPLPKLDMFAIPDFAVGAMENWGLITYRETALLYDPKKSAAYNRQRVAIVIAHELAHQWFGNLVTMEWWSDLWLKEGFASYLEYVAVDAVEPSLNTMLQFTVEDTQSVFSVDALTTSHPMSVPVSKRNEVNEVFDSIPYSKGPAVIRMLAGFLGEKTFRGGLTLYLNKKKYQNAVQDDLWEAMNEQTIADEVDLPTDVKTIMDSWSLLTGYPIVTVDRNYENYTAYISQERFFLLSDVSSRDKSLWWIPLTFTNDFNSIYLSWLLGNETLLELDLPDVEADQWILFNVEQVGYYRVNYDMNNWHLISQQLRSNHEKISILNRAQIIDDAFNIARTGQLVYGVPFELSRYLRLEKEFTPWKSALAALRYLDAMLYETSAKKNFRLFLKWLIQPAFDHVGFVERTNDTHLTTLNRNQILSWACKLGISGCVDNAAALYAKWMDDPDNDGIIGPNQKLVVTCAAIANGASTQWDFAYQRYLTTNLASEKETLLKALSCSKDTAILSKLLEWTMNSTSGIRRQDTLNIMSSVAANPVGQSMVFDFVVNRWDEMVKSFPSLYVLGRLVDSITLTLSSPSQLQHLKEMSEGKRGDLGTAARSIEHALERTRINVDWKNSYYKTVDALMASWYEAFQGQ